jgi:hypothetical protein
MSIGICVAVDCNKPIKVKGLCLCTGHYARKMSGKSVDGSLASHNRYNLNELCTVPDCGNKVSAKNLCKNHYNRQRTGIDLTAPYTPRSSPYKGKLCSAQSCGLVARANGLCTAHSRRTEASGLNTPVRVHTRYDENTLCKIQGCLKKPKGQGYCIAHYSRFMRGEPLDSPIREWPNPPLGDNRWRGYDGYIIIKVSSDTPGAKKQGRYDRYQMLEHRYVMQQHLGRPLLASETIHHRDGDRANNVLSNLELKPGRHGKGLDLLNGAHACLDYLERYVGLDSTDRIFLRRLRAKVDAGTVYPSEPKSRKHAA